MEIVVVGFEEEGLAVGGCRLVFDVEKDDIGFLLVGGSLCSWLSELLGDDGDNCILEGASGRGKHITYVKQYIPDLIDYSDPQMVLNPPT